jgi:predicted RNA-binding Zn-ribbon protein involved in translation (DUF1610 family)
MRSGRWTSSDRTKADIAIVATSFAVVLTTALCLLSWFITIKYVPLLEFYELGIDRGALYRRETASLFSPSGWRVEVTCRPMAVWVPYYSRLGGRWRLPLWIPAALAAGAALAVRRGSRRLRTADGCARCGYNLTGNVSGVCPECGTAISRSAAATRRGRWRVWVFASTVALCGYVGTWVGRHDLGVIQPCANLRYFQFAGGTVVDDVAYWIYRPLVRLDYRLQRLERSQLWEIHWRDRAPDPDVALMGP